MLISKVKATQEREVPDLMRRLAAVETFQAVGEEVGPQISPNKMFDVAPTWCYILVYTIRYIFVSTVYTYFHG